MSLFSFITSPPAALIWAAFFLGFSLQTVISDFKYRRVANYSLLCVLILQTLWLLASTLGLIPDSSWLQTKPLAFFAALIIYLAVLFPFWMKGILGGGDVKYIATLGYLVGFTQSFYLIVMGSLLVGLYALGLIAMKQVPVLYSFAMNQTEKHLPYAGCIALAATGWLLLKLIP